MQIDFEQEKRLSALYARASAFVFEKLSKTKRIIHGIC